MTNKTITNNHNHKSHINKSINLYSERYCHKCHQAKDKSLFKKVIHLFRISGICSTCTK